MEIDDLDRQIEFGLGRESHYTIDSLTGEYPLPQDGRMYSNLQEAEEARYGPEWMQEFHKRVVEEANDPNTRFREAVAGKLDVEATDLAINDDLASASRQRTLSIEQVRQRTLLRARGAQAQTQRLRQAIDNRKKMQKVVDTNKEMLRSLARGIETIADTQQELRGRPQQQTFAIDLLQVLDQVQTQLRLLDQELVQASQTVEAGPSTSPTTEGAIITPRSLVVLPTTLYSFAAELTAPFAGPLAKYMKHKETYTIFSALASFALVVETELMDQLPPALAALLPSLPIRVQGQMQQLVRDLDSPEKISNFRRGRIRGVDRTSMRSVIDYFMDPATGLFQALMTWAQQANVTGASRHLESMDRSLQTLLTLVNTARATAGQTALLSITPALALDYPKAYAAHERRVLRLTRSVAAAVGQSTETQYLRLEGRLNLTLATMWFDTMERAHAEGLLPSEIASERKNWQRDRSAAPSDAERIAVDKRHWKELESIQRGMLEHLEADHPLRTTEGFGTNPVNNPLYVMWQNYTRAVLLPSSERDLRKQDDLVQELSEQRSQAVERETVENLDEELERRLDPIRNTAEWAVRGINSGFVRLKTYVTTGMEDAVSALMVMPEYETLIYAHRHLEEPGGIMHDDDRVKRGGLLSLFMHSLTIDIISYAPFAALTAYCIQLNRADHPRTWTRPQVNDGLANKKRESILKLANLNVVWSDDSRRFMFSMPSPDERRRKESDRRYRGCRSRQFSRSGLLYNAKALRVNPLIKPPY